MLNINKKHTNIIPCINADKPINKFERLSWLVTNYLNNNILPNKSNLDIRQFIPTELEDNWSNVNLCSSPSRVLSDLFWMQLDWKSIENEIDRINILDTGCGDGEYFLKLNEFSNEILNTYCGIDIEKKDKWKSFKQEYSNVDFKEINSNDILNIIPKESNFFISQSAIEHFEEDLIYFQHLKNFISHTSNDVIQVHLFPAASCITQYIWHGIRQYTPRSVSQITKLFEETNSYSVLYKLGGNLSNQVHKEFITKPVYLKGMDYRVTKEDQYKNKLKHAITNDKNGKDPSFYALIIHSNYKNKIFQ